MQQVVGDGLKGQRVWVAGHAGMLGSALVRALAAVGAEALTVPRAALDLRDRAAVADWLADARPDMAIIAAARDMGLDLVTPEPEARRGGSVMLRLPGEAAPVVDALRAEGISTDGRGRILRASPGIVTTDRGVDLLIGGLQRHAKGA